MHALSVRCRLPWTTVLGAILLASTSLHAADPVWLADLDLGKMRAGWGQPKANLSVTGKTLKIAGREFAQGVGTHAASTLWVGVQGARRFQASVGVDDAAGNAKASIEFLIQGDGRLLWRSGVMKWGQPAQAVDVAVVGVTNLLLRVADAGDGVEYDHADWAEARFDVDGPRPQTLPHPQEPAILLTPKPGPAPRINGPLVYGCSPGKPFLYRIPTTGERPIRFRASGLPKGLVLDLETGIIRGAVERRGEYRVTLRAANGHGKARKSFRVVATGQLSLTPSMGYNHWYAHYDRITDRMMREAADILVRSGMADAGYQYVNIDDCWMNAPKHSDPKRVGPLRDAGGNLQPNQYFPDMKALTDYIHDYGLKAGTYTSPGPLTCGGFAGAYEHEAQDARQFAAWGFDFLKYDWCSYDGVVKGDHSRPALMKPYQLMGDLLKQQPRDILYNLCQYGMGEVWEWGAQVGGQSWRTAGDLGFELDRVFEVALANAKHRDWSRPGSWNDPDYLQIGFVGSAHGMGEPRPCPITPSEQYAYMSLWCLMAAPLFYSGDMTQLDEFTLNALCNPEVIDIDQDPLGQSARVVTLTDDTFALVKELSDGTRAVGLFNQGEVPTEVTVTWSQLGLGPNQKLRDVWRHLNLGLHPEGYSTLLPRRGGALLRCQGR